MKRWTFRILVCLMLGGIITLSTAVIVAWSGSPLEMATPTVVGISQRESPRWLVTVFESFGATAVATSWDSYPDTYWNHAEVIAAHEIPAWSRGCVGVPQSLNWSHHDMIEFGFGWPSRALGFEVRIVRHTPPGIQDYFSVEEAFWALPIVVPSELDPDNLERYRALPLRPMRGFIINSFFYGAICFVLYFGANSTRRSIRTRHGRCPRCGYDLQNNLADGCPECGWGRSIQPKVGGAV